MKKLFFDVETTGLDHLKNDIIQLSFIIETENKIVETKNYFIRPFNFSTVSSRALSIINTTIDQLKTYDSPKLVFKDIEHTFSKYIDKYDKKDKFFPVAYNGHFDVSFFRSFFIKNDSQYYGSWINSFLLDPLAILRYFTFTNEINLPSLKLSHVCQYFGIDLNAHDSLSDIQATREIFYILHSMINSKREPASEDFNSDILSEINSKRELKSEDFNSDTLLDLRKKFL